MLFKWFDFRGMKFVDQPNGRMPRIHNAHDLADYNIRVGQEMTRMRETLAEIERRSGQFLSGISSHIPVPPPRLTRPIF